MKRTRPRIRRPWFRLAVFGLLVALPLMWMVLGGRAQVTTDLFALLPQEERDPLLGAAMAQSRDAFFNQVDIVVHAPLSEREAASNAVVSVADALAVAPLSLNSASEQHAQLQAFYRENPFLWLTAEDRRALVGNPEAALRQRLAAALARPGNFNAADPAGFLDSWLASLPSPSGEWTLVEDFPARVTDNRIAIYLSGRLTQNAMQADVQQTMNAVIADARAAMAAACANCELHWTGAIRFSEATRQAAQGDVQRISVVAMLGIIALFALAFRSVRPLAAAITILGGGVLAGLTASFAVFGSLHALTLVFGTTLLGLSVDYVLHYLVHRWAHPAHDARQALRAVRPGLVLGLVTSMSAFAFLLFAGFPALSQLAVFSATGLATAFGLVSLWLPHALNAPAGPNVLSRAAASPARVSPRVRLAALAVILLAALSGLPQLRVVDDVRGLQATPMELLDDDAQVRKLTQGLPGRSGSDFFLVEGETLDAALQKERALFAADPSFGLSRFLPAQADREANRDAYATLFEGSPSVAQKVLTGFGFDASVADNLESAWSSGSLPSTDELLAHPALAQLAALRVRTGNGVALIARSPFALQVEGVRHVKPLEEVQATFSAIRIRAIVAVAGAYLLMLFVLARRYGFPGALRVLSPALLGAGCAVGLLGLAGLPLNIFSLVALILVLGIGADYALFLREGSEWPDTARLATGLAAMTSLLSFGLLVLSNLSALRAFGFATAAGIFTAWLAAPLALQATRARREESVEEVVHDRAA